MQHMRGQERGEGGICLGDLQSSHEENRLTFLRMLQGVATLNRFIFDVLYTRVSVVVEHHYQPPKSSRPANSTFHTIH